MEIRTVLDIAREIKKAHKEHHAIAVSVSQSTDEHGAALAVNLQAVFPTTALLVARLKSLWWGDLSAVDPVMFRDNSGKFTVVGPIHDGCGYLYVPYGSVKHRGPGLYDLELAVHLPAAGGAASTEVAQASCKFALPPPRLWRKVEYLWPLVGLCMAVVRADDEVVAHEVRGLKEFMISTFHLKQGDMDGLRAAMKNTAYGDLSELVTSVMRRMPLLGAEDLMRLLFHVARLDGPVNPGERKVLRRVADIVEPPAGLWEKLLSLPPGAPVLAEHPPRL